MTHRAKNNVRVFTREFVLVSLINMFFALSFQGLTPAVPLYLEDLHATSVQMGLSTTLAMGAALIVRIFIGSVLDRFGRMGVLFSGLLIAIFAVSGMAFVPLVGAVLALRFMQGIALGLGTTATSTIAADVVPEERFAEGMGYFAMTSAIATAIGPALAVELAQRGSMTMLLVVMATSAIVAFALTVVLKIGSPDIGSVMQSSMQRTGTAPADVLQPTGWSRFFEREAFLPTLAIILVNCGFAAVLSFMAVHAQMVGVEGISAFFVIYAVSNMLSRAPLGALIDRVGFRVPGAWACFFLAATLVVSGVATNFWVFCLAGVLCGLGEGTAISAFQTAAVANVDASRRGVAMSTFLFGFDLGIAVGGLIGGFLMTFMDTTMMFIVMAFFPVVGGLVFFGKAKR